MLSQKKVNNVLELSKTFLFIYNNFIKLLDHGKSKSKTNRSIEKF
jgi:hypothetical protein